MTILNLYSKLERSRYKDDQHVLKAIENIQASIDKVVVIAQAESDNEKQELNARLIKTVALINVLLNNDKNPANEINELNKGVTSLID